MDQLRNDIVDAALEIAERASWESVRLHHVATKLGISLDQIRVEFKEKEDIADAWFDRADQVMLGAAYDATQDLSPEQKIELAMMAWFGELGKHQKPTRQMIVNKFEFGHIHYQVDGAMRVSRTVQWMREVAGLEDTLPWRAFSEAGLTMLFLATFSYWMFDASSGYDKTSQFLQRKLKAARPWVALLGPGRHIATLHSQKPP